MAETGESKGALVVARCHAGKRGGRVQKRRISKGEGTKEERQRFLEILADSCNIREAARRIDRGTSTIYRWRAVDPAFRKAWDEAIEQAYAALEMEALRRARFGQFSTEYRFHDDDGDAGEMAAGAGGEPEMDGDAGSDAGAVDDADGGAAPPAGPSLAVVKRVHSYDNGMAMQLLVQHAARIAIIRASQGSANDGSRALEELKRKLLAMKQRGEDG